MASAGTERAWWKETEGVDSVEMGAARTPAPDGVTLAPGHGAGKRPKPNDSGFEARPCNGRVGVGASAGPGAPAGGVCSLPEGREACDQACAAMPLSIIWVSWPLPTAPIWVAWTWPSLNSSSIGMERTWYFIALPRFSSTFNLTTFSLPS